MNQEIHETITQGCDSFELKIAEFLRIRKAEAKDTRVRTVTWQDIKEFLHRFICISLNEMNFRLGLRSLNTLS
jgi:hypothetical protein